MEDNRFRPKISAIVPMTKMANRLGNLNSWLIQLDEHDIEVLLVHDIQDELTDIQLEELLLTISDPRIELIRGFFGAPGTARNAGLARARGDWLCFWDSDDLPYLPAIARAISTSDIATEVIVGQFEVENELTGHITKCRTSESINDLVNFPGLWRMAFRSNAICGMTFTGWNLGEDQLFLEEFNLEIRSVQFVSEDFYRYYFGGLGHLTNRRDLLIDLFEVAKLGSGLILSSSETIGSFVINLYFKQITTCILRGQRKLKYLAVINLYDTFIRASWAKKYMLCIAPILILQNRV